MGYKISYEPIKKLRGAEKHRTRIGALVGIFFLLFLLMVNLLWSEGMEVLREFVLPGDTAITTAALDVMSDDLKEGIPLQEAFKKFCKIILQNDFSSEN